MTAAEFLQEFGQPICCAGPKRRKRQPWDTWHLESWTHNNPEIAREYAAAYYLRITKAKREAAKGRAA